ncbi:MAG: SGNH/GDSL hydrolase family protein [Ignavibacteriae bacterium]|nr:SGNH/GDSL hydrolase family protein [Ignavibacteriota bacterium]
MKLKLIRNLLLTLTSLLVISLLFEIILCIFYEPLNSGWGWNDSPRKSLANFENDFPNQIGVRGQQINYEEDDFVILLLGDSQVEAATCSPDNMPEILLEKRLSSSLNNKVKVFSLAASGWGQDQQLLALEKYYNNYRADIVIVWVTPKNDFWENTFPDRSTSRNAGHLKPTFNLHKDKLIGPFLEPNNFYKNSALIQLFASGYQELNGKTIEQLILEEWMNELPAPHRSNSNNVDYNSIESTEIDLNKFSEAIFEYSDKQNITILTHEDFINSRSHFSPFANPRSERDNYLINITKKLLQKINDLAKSNESQMLALYPLREDFDIVYKDCVKYVKSYRKPNQSYSVNLDYLSTLKEIIPEEQLVYFMLDGKDEICVHKSDRHLNNKGNEQVAKKLSNILKKKISASNHNLKTI